MSDIKPVETGTARSDVVGETEPVKADLSHYDVELEEALRNYVPGSDAEKRLVRKLDLYLMPTVWFMYILAYIDRQNIVSRFALLHRVRYQGPLWHRRKQQPDSRSLPRIGVSSSDLD